VSVVWAAYRILAPCLGALAPAARVFASPGERSLWGERLGRLDLADPCQAWVHSASLGEARAVEALVHELVALRPVARFCLTATTRAGRTRLAELGFPAALAPIDAPQAVRRFFAGVRPERLLLVETELWPHWLLRARTAGVPVAVVSARLSERSVRRYRWLGAGLRRLIAGLHAVLCQSEDDRRRWLEVGAPRGRTAVVGNLKDDALPHPAESREAARAAFGLDRARPLLVLGSVRPGEVRTLARAWRALPEGMRERWQVVAVPRHARAASQLLEEAARTGQQVVGKGAPRAGAWRWDDRAGVLNGYYAAAEVAFVGGSLTPLGGHNPIEPAACGAAVVMGEHHESQAEGVRALREHQAIHVVHSEREVTEALRLLLGNDAVRERDGRAAREVAEARRGAARRAAARLVEWNLWPAH
jgi:3-deoxy-D-manno-octulosonic-acid transferase